MSRDTNPPARNSTMGCRERKDFVLASRCIGGNVARQRNSAVVLVTCLWALTGTGPMQTSAATQGRYEEVKDWPKLPPDMQFGEVAGVDVDANGHVLVFHRPGRGFEPGATEPLKDPAVVELDENTGRVISSWGANTFLVPHGITIDRDNNVWLTDVGLQQVFKFSHDGKLMLDAPFTSSDPSATNHFAPLFRPHSLSSVERSTPVHSAQLVMP